MSSPPQRIALVKLGAIGDVVNSLPLVCRLRAGLPAAHLTWIIAPLAHGLVEGHDAVDEFLVVDVKDRDRWRPTLRRLRGARYDLVIDLQRILKSGVIARATGAPRRLGFDRARTKELSWLFTNERIAPNLVPGVTVAQYLEFADHLELPEREPEWRLPRVAWTERPPRVALGLGASKPANLWPTERWAALATRLAEELGPENLALVGGPGDREAARAVLAGSPTGVLDAVGTLSLKQTAGLLAASEVFVAGDTGPLHMAVAVGTPVVALFGAADPDRTGPFGRADSVLRGRAPCAPCRRRDCNVEGHPCMVDLDVERVAGATLRALES